MTLPCILFIQVQKHRFFPAASFDHAFHLQICHKKVRTMWIKSLEIIFLIIIKKTIIPYAFEARERLIQTLLGSNLPHPFWNLEYPETVVTVYLKFLTAGSLEPLCFHVNNMQIKFEIMRVEQVNWQPCRVSCDFVKWQSRNPENSS